MKVGSISKHRGIWPANWLCALGVSRGGFERIVYSALSACPCCGGTTLGKIGA